MIFGLQFLLIQAGYSACGVLLGVYMIRYGGASDLDLGFVFMIQPFTIFFRPFISAKADRYQAHKRLLTWSILINVLAYIPFIVIPFLLRDSGLSETYLTPRVCFWILVSSHSIGSISFCGVRSLGDILAVSYAKRVGSNFTNYRLFGSLSFGIGGYLLGQINQGWILPDFVPTVITYVSCMTILLVLVYLWPDEYFVIIGDDSKQHVRELSSGKEIIKHMGAKLCRTLTCSPEPKDGETSLKDFSSPKAKRLSAKQQLSIFLLLFKSDIRIPLFLLLILYGGLVGYAPQNFVFTYMNQFCHEKGTCDPAYLAGFVMLIFCLAETACYLIISSLGSRVSHIVMLETTLVSLAIHYYFYGFFLENLSPYFFLVESMHGWEYSASLSSSVELGYKFGNEVELLIPELIERRIIRKEDDLHLVKVSLMATMNACFTLVYDGAGTIIGSFIYGLVTDKYNFTTTWVLIGSMSSCGFIIVLLVVLMGKCFNIKPQISKHQETKDGEIASTAVAV